MIGQRFPLDRLRTLTYIGASIVLAGCRPQLRPLVPDALPPVSRDSAIAWTEATIPKQPLAVRFKWLYRDERLRWPGRGTARFAPPDSVRIDYTGALGARSGAAVVVRDSVVWAEPAGDFQTMMPALPLMWAAFGIMRPPEPDTEVFARLGPSGAWRQLRFVRGGDTLEFVTGSGRGHVYLEGQWRRGGRVYAQSQTMLDNERPTTARIDFPEVSARFELTVVGIDSGAVAVLPPALWRSRR